MTELQTPLTEDVVRSLNVGEEVSISGIFFTGRDAVHKYLYEGGDLPPGISLQDGIIYHCGPVVMKDETGGWKVTAAGPTTSSREEPYQAKVIERFGIRAIIGKGGMGSKTLQSCHQCGCVYLHAIGGAAQVLADCVVRVRGVYFKEEFGSPEAVWELEVRSFPAVVTMDAKENSLHDRIRAASEAVLAKTD